MKSTSEHALVRDSPADSAKRLGCNTPRSNEITEARRSRSRSALSSRVVKGSCVTEELEDGYRLTYLANDRWRCTLAEFVSHFQERFEWLDFELDETPERIQLGIRGEHGAKSWIRELKGFANACETMETPSVVWRRRFRAVTSFARTLPDFLIIGVPRSGTSTLFVLLAQHPSVASAFTKEVAYFNVNYHRGPGWYRRHFPSIAAKRSYRRNTGTFQTFEATPTYLIHPVAPKRIRRLVPDAKLVVLLRNPVDRAYSHYHLARRIGYETLSFEEAIDAEPARIAGERAKMIADERYHSFTLGYLTYVTMGQYAEQLQRWMEIFPREQFHVLMTRQLRQNQHKASRRVLRFLGLPEIELPTTPPVFASRQPPMKPATRRRLQEHFRPHNEQLKALLGLDPGWDEPQQDVMG